MKCVPSLIKYTALLLAALAELVRAWPGDPDVAFGDARFGEPPGVAMVGSSLDWPWMPVGIAVAGDGKIVTAGESRGTFLLARFHENGTPDEGFGDGGRMKSDVYSGDVYVGVGAFAVQADGNILVAGHGAMNANANTDLAIMRHLPDGTLDPSFGNGGRVVASVTGAATAALDLEWLSDGRIIVLGQARRFVEPVHVFNPVLFRFLPNGNPDVSFGTGGSVELPGPAALRMAVQADGKILLGGTAEEPGVPGRFHLRRCGPDGLLDASFAAGGELFSSDLPGLKQQFKEIAVQSDGKILLAGEAWPPFEYDSTIQLLRYHPDGSPDISFNGTGRVLTDFPPNAEGEGFGIVRSLALQPDGKLVVAGMSGTLFVQDHMMIARYLTDGALDPGFGAGGMALSDKAGSPGCIALLPDGKILTGCVTQPFPSSSARPFLARTIGGDPLRGLALELPDGTPLTAANRLDLGSAVPGMPPLETRVMLRNKGVEPVTGLSAVFVGQSAGNFRLDAALPAVLDGHSSFPLTVRFFPSSEPFFNFNFNAWLSITCAGPPADSVLLPLRAKTQDPVATLAVLDGAVTVAPGASVHLGASNAEFPATRTFTLKNTGNIDLLLQGASLGAEGNPNDFSVGSPETDLLPPGGSTALPVTFTASGQGERTATLRIASTDTFNLPFVMQLRGTLPQGPDAWRLTHFGTLRNEGAAADSNDPDDDRIPNLMEYALLTDPNAFSVTPADLIRNGDYLEYTFTRPSGATAFLTYTLERTNSVQGTTPPDGWYPAFGSQETVLTDDSTRQHVKISLFAGDLHQQFVRLRVSRK